jgi:hypothetical protein
MCPIIHPATHLPAEGDLLLRRQNLIADDEQFLAIDPSLVQLAKRSELLTWHSAKLCGFGAAQGAGRAVAVLCSTGEPGKARPIRRGGRTAKRIVSRDPGKVVAVWSST